MAAAGISSSNVMATARLLRLETDQIHVTANAFTSGTFLR